MVLRLNTGRANLPTSRRIHSHLAALYLGYKSGDCQTNGTNDEFDPQFREPHDVILLSPLQCFVISAGSVGVGFEGINNSQPLNYNKEAFWVA